MDEIRITERDMEELQRQPGITGYIVREGGQSLENCQGKSYDYFPVNGNQRLKE